MFKFITKFFNRPSRYQQLEKAVERLHQKVIDTEHDSRQIRLENKKLAEEIDEKMKYAITGAVEKLEAEIADEYPNFSSMESKVEEEVSELVEEAERSMRNFAEEKSREAREEAVQEAGEDACGRYATSDEVQEMVEEAVESATAYSTNSVPESVARAATQMAELLVKTIREVT